MSEKDRIERIRRRITIVRRLQKDGIYTEPDTDIKLLTTDIELLLSTLSAREETIRELVEANNKINGQVWESIEAMLEKYRDDVKESKAAVSFYDNQLNAIKELQAALAKAKEER